MRLDVRCPTEADTAALGERLGRNLLPGDCILLYGELGAGKTVFAKGIAAGYGIGGPITSPSFGLMHVHETGERTLVHVDAYRLRFAQDLLDIGLADYLGSDAVVIVEWPDRLDGLTPTDRIDVSLAIEADDARTVVLEDIGMIAGRLAGLEDRC